RHKPVAWEYITLGLTGSKTKNRTTPRKLNIRHDCPPSCVIYEPVMSQEIRTVLGSCGLTVGLNIAPPPPGPTTWKSPGRAAKAAPTRRKKQRRWRAMFRIRYFRLLSFVFALPLSGKAFKLSTAKWPCLLRMKY